ncbi:MAG: HIRAN domain-containing protein [Bacteroidia bacterium]
MREFGHIYLSWRRGPGHRRFIVGVIKSSATGGTTFSYRSKEIELAKAQGFSAYTEFPELDKIYTENVLEVFGQRIIKSERQDISAFLDFWEIDYKYKEEKLYLLAHTMGLVPTDNFELLADFHPVKNLCFITDLAAVSHLKLSTDLLTIEDELRFEKEPENDYDKYAVKIFRGEHQIGYVKKVHSKIFYSKRSEKLKLQVKALEKNGTIKKIFIKIYF